MNGIKITILIKNVNWSQVYHTIIGALCQWSRVVENFNKFRTCNHMKLFIIVLKNIPGTCLIYNIFIITKKYNIYITKFMNIYILMMSQWGNDEVYVMTKLDTCETGWTHKQEDTCPIRTPWKQYEQENNKMEEIRSEKEWKRRWFLSVRVFVAKGWPSGFESPFNFFINNENTNPNFKRGIGSCVLWNQRGFPCNFTRAAYMWAAHYHICFSLIIFVQGI